MEEQLEDISLIPDGFGIQSEAMSESDLEGLDWSNKTSSAPTTIAPIEPVKPAETPAAKPIEKEAAPKVEDVQVETETPENTTEAEETEEEETETEEGEFNQFEAIAKDLVEIGILSLGDGEKIPTTSEELEQKFRTEIQTQANNTIYQFLIDKHGEEGLQLFQSIFVNGVSIPDYLNKYAQVESLKDLDISTEENQERVYRAYYKKIGWSEDKIENKIKKLKDYGDLQEEAEIVYERLVEDEAEDLKRIEAESAAQQKALQQQQALYRSTLNNILVEKLKTKELDGIPVTEQVASQVFADLTKPAFQLPNGKQITKFDKDILELDLPENYETKLKIALLLRNNFDFSKIKAKAVSEEKSKIFNNLVSKEKTKKRTTGTNPKVSFGDYL